MPYRSFMPITSTEYVAAAGSATVASGRRLRLYEAMASLGSVTPLRLAIATRTSVWVHRRLAAGAGPRRLRRLRRVDGQLSTRHA